MSLNTDDPTLFQTTLTEEYVHAIRHCGLHIGDIRKSILDSLRSSYLTDGEKLVLQNELKREFNRLDDQFSKPET